MRIWGREMLQPHIVDPRSMATLRIFLSIYILYDIFVSRFGFSFSYGFGNLRFWLSWYTSTPKHHSILAIQDTPHTAALHQVWFYRGSIHVQLALFGLTTLLAILMGVGYNCTPRPVGVVPCLLWLNVVAMQNRCVVLCDGSDTFLRSILLWVMLVDSSALWSVDHYYRRRLLKGVTSSEVKLSDLKDSKTELPDSLRKRSTPFTISQTQSQIKINTISKSNPKPVTKINNRIIKSKPICSIATLGLTLQIALMYLGTISQRFKGTMWLYPQFSAVYYALSHSFSTKQFAATLLQSYPYAIGRPMTIMAMLIESCAPVFCLLCPYRRFRHGPACLVMLLHLGLLGMMRIPNWQILGIICCVIWIPSNVWDNYNNHKKKQWWLPCVVHVDHEANDTRTNNKASSISAKLNEAVSMFFLLYMVYNWMGERQWIPKHDNGDIGEALRFSQHWVMFSPDVGTFATTTIYTGYLTNDTSSKIDLLCAIRYNDWVGCEISNDLYEYKRTENAENMSSRYPSMRFERALMSWTKEPHLKQRVTQMGKVLCSIGNDKRNRLELTTMDRIEMAWRGMRVLSPEQDGRFSHYPTNDMELVTYCD